MTRRSVGPWWRRLAGAIYVVALVAVVVAAFRSDWPEVSEQLRNLSVVHIAGALLLSAAALACSVAAWITILRSLGERVPVRAGSRIFLVSQAGKYLPGSVWAAVVQVQMGRETGIGRSANLASFFIALLAAIVSGLVTGAAAWAVLDPVRFLVVIPGLFIVGALSWILLRQWPQLRKVLPETVSRRLPPQRPSANALIKACGILSVGWVLNGMQFYLVATSLGISGSELAVRSVAAYAVAFVGGLLFIIAPAGTGVREGILVVFLESTASVGVVTAAAVISRFVVTLVDLGGAALGASLGVRSPADPDPPTEFK